MAEKMPLIQTSPGGTTGGASNPNPNAVHSWLKMVLESQHRIQQQMVEALGSMQQQVLELNKKLLELRASGQFEQLKQQFQCTKCGRIHGKDCPAEGRKCNKCKKEGHFAKFCTEGQKSGRVCKSVRIRSALGERRAPRVCVDIFSTKGKRLRKFRALPDTGSEASVAGLSFLKETGVLKKELKKPTPKENDKLLMNENVYEISSEGEPQVMEDPSVEDPRQKDL